MRLDRVEIAGSDTKSDPTQCGRYREKIIVEKSRRETSSYQYGSGSSVNMLHTGHWWSLSARLRGGKILEQYVRF